MGRMDKSSESLIRSTLHDMANVLAGVKGILELNRPGQPLAPRDRERLEAVVDEGIATLDRCRHLTMASLPEGPLEDGPAWRERLLAELQPMAALFRCRIDLVSVGAPDWDRWPGQLMLGYLRAVTRHVMPFARGATLTLRCSAGPEGWEVAWSPAPRLPEGLAPGHDESSLDLCARWAAWAGSALGASLSCQGGALQARVPRPDR